MLLILKFIITRYFQLSRAINTFFVDFQIFFVIVQSRQKIVGLSPRYKCCLIDLATYKGYNAAGAFFMPESRFLANTVAAGGRQNAGLLRLRPIRIVSLVYLFLCLLGAALLSLPAAQVPGHV